MFETLTVKECERLADKMPEGLDVFTKLYCPQYVTNAGVRTMGIPVTDANKTIPAEYYMKFERNAYYFLTHISVSFYNPGATVANTDTPYIKFTDTANNKELQAQGNNYIAQTADKFIPILGNFTPGNLDKAVPINDNLIYLHEMAHLFEPQSQCLIEILNPAAVTSLIVDVCFRGYVIRQTKV